jgi:C_GCAxxG_C_C family probable redox protein
VTEMDVVEIARAYYLDDRNQFGCAETTFIVLKGAFGLDDPMDSSAAMALNGGVAYSGGICGAVSGAALAVGMLAEQRIADHREAKRVARELVARLMDDFRAQHGSVDCRDLIGIDLRAPGGHERFIESGTWRDGCMRQIEFAVRWMAPLVEEEAWERAVRELEAPRS